MNRTFTLRTITEISIKTSAFVRTRGVFTARQSLVTLVEVGYLTFIDVLFVYKIVKYNESQVYEYIRLCSLDKDACTTQNKALKLFLIFHALNFMNSLWIVVNRRTAHF